MLRPAKSVFMDDEEMGVVGLDKAFWGLRDQLPNEFIDVPKDPLYEAIDLLDATEKALKRDFGIEDANVN